MIKRNSWEAAQAGLLCLTRSLSDSLAAPWLRMLIGSALLLAATELRLWATLEPLGLQQGYPYVTMLPAAILAALLAGLTIGGAVALLGGLIAWYLFARPPGTIGLAAPSDVLSLLAFWALAAWNLLLIGALRRIDGDRSKAAPSRDSSGKPDESSGGGEWGAAMGLADGIRPAGGD